MKRQHFKLDRGYLNIDEDALIFTRSGNWQEAESTVELSAKGSVEWLFRFTFGVVLIVAGGLFLSLGELRHTLHEGSIVLAVGLGGWGIHKMYKLLCDDMVRTFRIPLSKVRRLTSDDDHLEIHFLNGSFKGGHLRVKAPPAASQFAEKAWMAWRDRG